MPASVAYGSVDNVDRVSEDPMAERPFLTIADVGALGGVTAQTVSKYLQRSKPDRPYAADPFPAPDDRNGKWPWWALEREVEIREWFARQQDRSGVGGRPRKDAAQD